MGSWVVVSLTPILCLCDRSSICIDDHGTYWHVSCFASRLRQCNRPFHPLPMSHIFWMIKGWRRQEVRSEE
jgi:hypothetical protein